MVWFPVSISVTAALAALPEEKADKDLDGLTAELAHSGVPTSW